MLVVLDTNVLLSALITPNGIPDVIYRAWRESRFELVTSTMQLDELRRISRYPKLRTILPPHRAGTMINNLQRAIVLDRLPETRETQDLADPDDEFLLAMALAGQVDWLVTGDHRAGLLQLGNFGRTRIGSPATFSKAALA